eukprot:2212927-Prymnesium_polylepis.1
MCSGTLSRDCSPLTAVVRCVHLPMHSASRSYASLCSAPSRLAASSQRSSCSLAMGRWAPCVL